VTAMVKADDYCTCGAVGDPRREAHSPTCSAVVAARVLQDVEADLRRVREAGDELVAALCETHQKACGFDGGCPPSCEASRVVTLWGASAPKIISGR
jgi:hypothetical protein